MYDLKQNSSIDWPFFAFDLLGDAVPGKLDDDFEKWISKAGGNFYPMDATIVELAFGFYQLPIASSHTSTLGAMTIVLIGAGIKQVNLQFKVCLFVIDDFAPPPVSLDNPCAQNPARTRGPTTEPQLIPTLHSRTRALLLETTNNH
jgi:hypothetical protein